jgi:uncharacterized protein (DUF697 family)
MIKAKRATRMGAATPIPFADAALIVPIQVFEEIQRRFNEGSLTKRYS